MKNINKIFAIALVVAIVSVFSISTAMAHNEAGQGWSQAGGTCKHSHHLKDLNGDDVHTDNSPSRLAGFQLGKACTTHDGHPGTCKTTMRRTPRWNHTWAVCERNSISYSNRSSNLNLGRNRLDIQSPRYEYSLRTQPQKSEKSESVPAQTRRSEYSGFTNKFSTYGLR